MQECPQCGEVLEARFRFCPMCAAPLRRKIVEFFPATLEVDHEKGPIRKILEDEAIPARRRLGDPDISKGSRDWDVEPPTPPAEREGSELAKVAWLPCAG